MLTTFGLALLLTSGLLGYFLRQAYLEERARLTERIEGELNRLGSERLISQLATVTVNLDSSQQDTVIDVGKFKIRQITPQDSSSKRPDAEVTLRTFSGSGTQTREVTRSGLLQSIQLSDRQYARVLDSLSEVFGVRLFNFEPATASDTTGLIVVRRDKGFWGLSGAGTTGGVAMSRYRGTLFAGISLELGFSALIIGLLLTAGYLAYKNQKEYVEQLRQKDFLLANLSHELKSPIAAVGVALEALDTFGADERPELRRQYIQMSRTELARLDQLADYSLSVLKTPDAARLPFAALDLREVIERACLATRSRYALEADALTWITPPPPAARVQGLAQELELAVVNLLDNAVKYGGHPPHVELDLQSTPATWTLSVTDNGRGVPESEQERIFESFYRATRKDTGHAVKGQGLGLSLVRQIANLHGGSVSVTSPSGGGASFHFRIARI